LISSKKAISPIVKETTENLIFIKKLIERGTIKPTVDSSFPMEQAAEAHRYFEGGLKKGSVIITLKHDKKN
jgi:NADPH:quinone reductase-like Zn-dependent oxidoreductase